MKLTGELKDKVDQTTNLEEARDVIAQAGMLLTDDEVSEVAGGFGEGSEHMAPNPFAVQPLRCAPKKY